MAANAALQPVDERGALRGFANLFAKENGAWWRTRSWWLQSLIWLAILNGMTAMLLWVAPDPAAQEAAAEPGIERPVTSRVDNGLTIFFVVGGIATVIGAVIIGQDALIAEKVSGTAAWVLSKPVSRNAFILAKLAGDGLGMLVTMIVVQGLVAYIQLRLGGSTAPPLGFAAGLGLLYLNLMYYYCLSLMLGALSRSRGPVIGIPLALVFAYQLFLGIAPWLGNFMPWALTVGGEVPIAPAVAMGQPLTAWGPVVGTLAGCVVFVGVALWRFGREEF
jgi:ABC-2 type transport system permease protein